MVARGRRVTGRARLQRRLRIVDWLALPVGGALIALWSLSIARLYSQERSPGEPVTAPRASVGRSVSSALLDPRARSTAYLDDAALEFLGPLRGSSGKMRAVFRLPGSEVAPGVDAEVAGRYQGEKGSEVVSPGLDAPTDPGIYRMAVEIDNARRAIDDLRLITLVPFSAKKEGKIGLYYIGRWPYETGGTPKSPAYAPPSGFVEVTRQNKDTRVSEHFRLGDFLTKGQVDVWPKYVVIDPRLLDKLELIIQEVEAGGHDVRHVTVMSGFRTPHYNVAGGNTGGRASLSRHMYGDASDVFVDNDRNGTMDDLNRDGRVDERDADVIGQAAERVERRHPALVGGIGVYKACCGHGPFTHVDVRGYRARWRGSGNG